VRAARGFLWLLSVPVTVLALALGTGAWGAAGGEVTITGKLIDVHSDDFARGQATHQYWLETDQGTYELRFSQSPALPRASKVRVHGQRSGNTITVAAGGVNAAPGSTTTGAATGAKRVAVILITFSDNSTQPYTPAYANGVAFANPDSVASYYAEISWGGLQLSGDVFGWYALKDKSTSCDYTTWASDANAAVNAGGVDLSAYDYRVYAFPYVKNCYWAGLSYMPGTQSWLNGASGMSLHVMAHELGHNFGTHHANSYACNENGTRVSLSANTANCTSTEYGDPWSVMGGLDSRRQVTNFSRGNFGWLSGADTLDISQNGTYTLSPVEPSNPTGAQALRVKRDSSSYLLLEFRQPYGSYFDNFLPIDLGVNGVFIRIVPSYSMLTQSQLVDATPATSSYGDAALAVGKSLYDPLSKVTFSTVAVGTTGATVQVTFGQDATSPTAPTNLAASATDASHIALSWNPATDNVGVTGYKIYRGGTYLATTQSTSYTDGSVQAATTYTYMATALDAVGNESSPSAPTSVSTPTLDTTPPTTPSSLVANANDSADITLAWATSTDNVSVAGYRVYRGGTFVATTSSTSYTDNGLSASTTYTYSVTAVDTAGNESTESAPASATTAAATDSSAPSAPTGVAIVVTGNGNSSRVTVSWSAAADDVAVAGYRIFINGSLVKTVSAGTLDATVKAPKGDDSFYVVAYDGAGNVSAPSATVQLTL
jgi:chitodextrinase